VDLVIERCAYAMQAPMFTTEWFSRLPCPADWGMGPGLIVNVEAKIGPDWGTMTPIAVPAAEELGLSNDVPYTPAEDADEDDVLDLETRMSA
jgi:hypothetical protein